MPNDTNTSAKQLRNEEATTSTDNTNYNSDDSLQTTGVVQEQESKNTNKSTFEDQNLDDVIEELEQDQHKLQRTMDELYGERSQ